MRAARSTASTAVRCGATGCTRTVRPTPTPQPTQPQLPPIVVVNSLKDREARKEREGDSSSEYSSDDDGVYRGGKRAAGADGAVPGRAVVRDPELRNEAGGALLLRSSRLDSSPGRRNQPLVL